MSNEISYFKNKNSFIIDLRKIFNLMRNLTLENPLNFNYLCIDRKCD